MNTTTDAETVTAAADCAQCGRDDTAARGAFTELHGETLCRDCANTLIIDPDAVKYYTGHLPADATVILYGWSKAFEVHSKTLDPGADALTVAQEAMSELLEASPDGPGWWADGEDDARIWWLTGGRVARQLCGTWDQLHDVLNDWVSARAHAADGAH